MECIISRRNFPSKIHQKYDILYFKIVIRDNGRRIYEKLLNPIYNLDEFLVELQKTYKFNEISSPERTTPEISGTVG